MLELLVTDIIASGLEVLGTAEAGRKGEKGFEGDMSKGKAQSSDLQRLILRENRSQAVQRGRT